MSIPLRALGRNGVKVSALGLGGHHVGQAPSYEEAERIVHEAMDGGVTFFDNCWEYHNGKSEMWLGRALEGRRDKVFLMTKVCTHGRNAALALKMLDESLRRLKTDHLDLWQVHGMGFDNDPERAHAIGGVVEALESAKRAGKVRFVGFTGHKSPDVHLRMLAFNYPFDTVQMPLNPFDAGFHTSFTKRVLPELVRRGIAPLGMKPMGGTAASVKQGLVRPEELLRYAMSLPVATTISGCESIDVLRKNLHTAQSFVPMTEPEMEALRTRCRPYAGDGRFELYKVSLKYDNPEARIAHDFSIDPTQMEVKEEMSAVTTK